MLLTPLVAIVKVLTDANSHLHVGQIPQSQGEYGNCLSQLGQQSCYRLGWRTYTETGRSKCRAMINSLDTYAHLVA